jgi:hypothetical protein
MMRLQLAALFLLALDSHRKICSRTVLGANWTTASFALEARHDEQAAADGHNIFKRGDHQVGNLEGLH